MKLRKVAGSIVASLPQSVLEPIGLKAGDRVIVEAAPPRRIYLTKESSTMSTAKRMELEIDLLEKKKSAIESDLSFKIQQHNKSMPIDEGMDDESVAELTFKQLERDRDRLDVEIAEKRLELYDAVGAPVVEIGAGATKKAQPARRIDID